MAPPINSCRASSSGHAESLLGEGDERDPGGRGMAPRFSCRSSSSSSSSSGLEKPLREGYERDPGGRAMAPPFISRSSSSSSSSSSGGHAELLREGDERDPGGRGVAPRFSCRSSFSSSGHVENPLREGYERDPGGRAMAPPFTSSSSGCTGLGALMEATLQGNLRSLKGIAKSLTEGKGEPSSILSLKMNGVGVLHIAARSGHMNVCKYFVEGLSGDVNAPGYSTGALGVTPFMIAAWSGHARIVKYFYDHGGDLLKGDNKGMTVLHHAAASGSYKTTEFLLSKGVPVNIDYCHGTPFFMAAANEQDKTMKLLLNHHANPNIIISGVGAPLPNSLTHASLKCLKLLIKAGAHVKCKDTMVTLLSFCTMQGGYTNFIKCLLKAGADPNIPDDLGRLPIELAATRDCKEEVEMLFPLTAPIPNLPDWSIEGVISNAKMKIEDKKPVALQQWRDFIARQQDESTGYVLPNKALTEIEAKKMPTTTEDLRRIVKSKYPIVEDNLDLILDIVCNATENSNAFEAIDEQLKIVQLRQETHVVFQEVKRPMSFGALVGNSISGVQADCSRGYSNEQKNVILHNKSEKNKVSQGLETNDCNELVPVVTPSSATIYHQEKERNESDKNETFELYVKIGEIKIPIFLHPEATVREAIVDASSKLGICLYDYYIVHGKRYLNLDLSIRSQDLIPGITLNPRFRLRGGVIPRMMKTETFLIYTNTFGDELFDPCQIPLHGIEVSLSSVGAEIASGLVDMVHRLVLNGQSAPVFTSADIIFDYNCGCFRFATSFAGYWTLTIDRLADTLRCLGLVIQRTFCYDPVRLRQGRGNYRVLATGADTDAINGVIPTYLRYLVLDLGRATTLVNGAAPSEIMGFFRCHIGKKTSGERVCFHLGAALQFFSYPGGYAAAEVFMTACKTSWFVAMDVYPLNQVRGYGLLHPQVGFSLASLCGHIKNFISHPDVHQLTQKQAEALVMKCASSYVHLVTVDLMLRIPRNLRVGGPVPLPPPSIITKYSGFGDSFKIVNGLTFTEIC